MALGRCSTGSPPVAQKSVAVAPGETGSLKGFYFDMWVGLFVPADTPIATKLRLNAALNAAQSSPEFRAFAAKAGVVPLEKPFSLAQVTQYYAEVSSQYRRLARAVNLQPK